MSDGLEFGQSIRSTILDDKDNEGSSPSDKKYFSKKALIIVVCILCIIALTVGLVLYCVLRDNDNKSTPEPKPEPDAESEYTIKIPQEFWVTIEVFKFRKGEKELGKKTWVNLFIS